MSRIVKTALIWAAITLGFCAAVIEAARAEEKCAAVGRIIITDYGATAETGDGGMVWVPKTQVRFDDEGPLRVCVGSYTGPRLYIPSDAWPQFAHQKLTPNAWIDRSSNKKGERCCDAGKDCFSLAPDRIEHVQGGVNVTLDDGQRIFVPGDQIMPSEDGKYWACYWGGQLKCFFAPYSGS